MTQLKTRRHHKWLAIARHAGFKVREFSRILGVSEKQLRRNAWRLFGLGPSCWLKEQRLQAAGKLLKKHRSVKDVCFRLHFKQPSHFSREFKSFYGISPIQFLNRDQRRTAKTNNNVNVTL